MSNWDEIQKRPTDFVALLYDDEEQISESEISVSGDENDGSRTRSPSPEAPQYSPLSSPQRCESRGRSRSPIRLHQPNESAPLGNVVRIFDEDGIPLDTNESVLPDAEDIEDDTFLAPDAHAMFVYLEETPMDEINVRKRGRTEGRGRSVRRGSRMARRGRSARRRGFQHRSRRGIQWVIGHPLNEIWTTDDDVPPELVSLARDVMSRREARTIEAARAERYERERNWFGRGNESESEDEEFSDASDGMDSLPRMEGQNPHFEWATMESFQGREENFVPERTGSVKDYNSAYDAFRSYWDEEILSLIVAETNKYASKIVTGCFRSEWYPTNIDEILCMFAFWMMLGIVRMPTVTSCFSADPLLKTEVFTRIFTRRRYENLSRALHFINSDPATNDRNPSLTDAARKLDRLYTLRPIISHLNSKFQSNYVLGKDICIDESLTLWKGRLDIKQYIRSKASKYGIKTFELCESTTGYLWSFIVYAGKKATPDLEQSLNVLKSTTIVKQLIGPLLNKGYRLFMDNWYSSPHLARFLKLNGTDCVGTLRTTRQDVPVVVNEAPLKRGDIIARHSGDVSVLAWQDKKRITMISTCHGSATALPRVASRPLSRPLPYKPQVVLDYNKFMGGVDLKDQMLEPYLLERKRCNKWYMKLFKRLLNISILNSRILLQSSTHKHYDHLAFRLQLVDSILTNHLSHVPKSRRFTVSNSRSKHQQPGRIILHSHWPAPLQQTASSLASNRQFRKRCVVCLREGRRSQKTSFCCEACSVPLCITNCFKLYHTSSS